MNGIYLDTKTNHWRVRITVEGEKQKHLGATSDKTVALAMYDLFVHLNGLQDSHLPNLPRMTVVELYQLVEENDHKALKNLMRKSDLILIRNPNFSPVIEISREICND